MSPKPPDIRDKEPQAPFLRALQQQVLVADGAMGTLLLDRSNCDPASLSELNLKDRDCVQQAHLDYILAGADLIQTNTFGANRLRLEELGLEGKRLKDRIWDMNVWGAKIARNSREVAGRAIWVAGSMGPLGKSLAPLGPLQPKVAHAAFVEQAEALLAGGVDLFILETLSDPRELLIAARAVRSVCRLPIVGSMTFSSRGETWYGMSVSNALRSLLEDGLPPIDVLGVNCGAGPLPVLEVIDQIRAEFPQLNALPLAAQPNAGQPQRVAERYSYPSTAEYFGDITTDFLHSGVRLLGGCCGTTPAHVQAMKAAVEAAEKAASGGNSGARRSTMGLRKRKQTPAPPSSTEEGEPELDPVSPGQAWQDHPPLLQRLEQGGVISVELDPPRGSQTGKYLADARILQEAGADFLNVADSPMARVRMSAIAGTLLAGSATGISPIIHYTTRDRNLMGIQSDLLGAHALGIRNVLALTGDAPGLGDYAHATAVFDVDSIGLIEILCGLNAGRDIGGNPIGQPTRFTIGAALNLNAERPEELALETRRFQRKLKAGAHYVMTQPIYEPGPYEAMLDKLGGIEVPVLLGIMPLHSLKHAEYLHNEVPGITVPAHIRDALGRAGKDGERVGLELAEELMEHMAPLVAGFYLVPSFGRCARIGELIQRQRKRSTHERNAHQPKAAGQAGRQP